MSPDYPSTFQGPFRPIPPNREMPKALVEHQATIAEHEAGLLALHKACKHYNRSFIALCVFLGFQAYYNWSYERRITSLEAQIKTLQGELTHK